MVVFVVLALSRSHIGYVHENQEEDECASIAVMEQYQRLLQWVTIMLLCTMHTLRKLEPLRANKCTGTSHTQSLLQYSWR